MILKVVPARPEGDGSTHHLRAYARARASSTRCAMVGGTFASCCCIRRSTSSLSRASCSSALGLLSLAITLGSSGGLEIGGLTWQPIFAGGILLIIGTNALMIGSATHLYAASRGLIVEDGLARFLRRQFTLERVLGFAGVLLAIGIGLDLCLFYEWVTGVISACRPPASRRSPRARSSSARTSRSAGSSRRSWTSSDLVHTKIWLTSRSFG